MLMSPVTGPMSCAELSPATSAIGPGSVDVSMTGASFVPSIVITRSRVPTVTVPSATCAA